MKLVSFGVDTTPGNEIRILADPRNADASLAGDGVVLFDELRPAGRHELPLSCQARAGVCRYRLFVGDLAHEIIADRNAIRRVFVVSTQALTQFAVVDKILEQFMEAEPVPIATRVNRQTLETTVRSALSSFNVTTDVAFGILSAKDGTVVMANPESSGTALARSPFRARLFPNDVHPGEYDLVCHVPSQQSALLRQLGPSVATSVLFILVTLGCFAFIVTAVFSQRRFSLLLTEFINNMAHEFKTPISTISLASDAIGRSAEGAGLERVVRYSRVIQEEATRMRHQVEKILEMAVLERKESGFRMSEVDLHALIGKAVDRFAPEIEKRSGRVTTALGAETPCVDGDEVHLLNVLRNLLDNALKYNTRSPDLHIATTNTARGVAISVRDNGIGMRPDDLKRIWDRYYRVQRGNAHDVKGFGLGLSDVKRIVRAHGGSIRVASEERMGSVFDIELPFRAGSATKGRRRRDEPRTV